MFNIFNTEHPSNGPPRGATDVWLFFHFDPFTATAVFLDIFWHRLTSWWCQISSWWRRVSSWWRWVSSWWRWVTSWWRRVFSRRINRLFRPMEKAIPQNSSLETDKEFDVALHHPGKSQFVCRLSAIATLASDVVTVATCLRVVIIRSRTCVRFLLKNFHFHHRESRWSTPAKSHTIFPCILDLIFSENLQLFLIWRHTLVKFSSLWPNSNFQRNLNGVGGMGFI